MKKFFEALTYAFITTALVAISFSSAQNLFDDKEIGFVGSVSVQVYCTFSPILGADNSACDSNIDVEDKTPGNESSVVTNGGTTTLTTPKIAQVNNAITRSLNNDARVVYVQGPAGRDGKNGTTTIVYQTAIAGASNPAISAYIYPGNPSGYGTPSYQTTVPGDIHSTFIHFLRVEEVIGLLANFVNLNATNTNTVNLIANNATTGNLIATSTFNLATGTIGGVNIWLATITDSTTTNSFITNASITNATSTNLYSLFANLINLLATDATITNATTTNLFATNASVTNATATNIFANYASITAATTTDLFSTRASITEATTTYFFAAWATFLNMFVENLTFTNATGTNLQVANASTTNFSATGTSVITSLYGNLATFTDATTTNLFSVNASITNATSTNLFTVWFNALNASIDNLLFLNATGTNLQLANLSTTNINATGTATITSAVITNATTTNLFATNASLTNATTTNLFAVWANFLNLFVDSLSFNNATGTNIQLANASTTNFSATGTSVITNLYGSLATFTAATTTDLFSTRASITEATTTNLFSVWFNALNAMFTNLVATNATLTNATTTNLVSENSSTTNLLVTNATVTNLYAVGGNNSLGTTTVFGSLVPNASTTTHTLGTALLPWAELFVSSSSVYIGGNKISNVDGVLTWNGNGINITGGNATLTAATINASTTNASTTNTESLNAAVATLTSATTSNLFATLFIAVNASIDGLVATNATFTSATSTNFFSTFANFTNLVFVNLTGTNATITNATTTNFATTNLTATGIFSLATGTIASTTINWANVNNLWARNASIEQATVTNSTSTNLFAANFVANKLKTGSTQIGFRVATVTIPVPGPTIVTPSVSDVNDFSGVNVSSVPGGWLALPSPTGLNDLGKIYMVNNVGTNTIIFSSVATNYDGTSQDILPGEGRQFVWTGSKWSAIVGNLGTASSTGQNTVFALRSTFATSTGVTADPGVAHGQLTFAAGANEKWIIQATLGVDSSSPNPDVSVGVGAPTGSTCNVSFVFNGDESNSTATCNTLINTGLNGASDVVKITGVITTGSTAGNVSINFGRVGGSGTAIINASSALTAFKLIGADLAEVYFAKDTTIEEGDVVALDGTGVSQVTKSNKPYQKNVLGIISTKPGLVMGEVDGEGKAVIVGLSGRVPVKVTAKNGNVKAGDFLAASDIPGFAMKATGAGQVIGQALTDMVADSEGKGKVMVFIKNTYHDGNSDDDTADTIADKFTSLVKNTIEKLSGVMLSVNLWVSELKADTVTANRTVVQEFCVGTECFNEADMKEFRNYLNSKKPVSEPQVPAVEPQAPTPVTEEETVSKPQATPVEPQENSTPTEEVVTTETETPTETPVEEVVSEITNATSTNTAN